MIGGSNCSSMLSRFEYLAGFTLVAVVRGSAIVARECAKVDGRLIVCIVLSYISASQLTAPVRYMTVVGYRIGRIV